MQSHFVVCFDHETGFFEIDWGTTDARFDEGTFWNGNEWVQHSEMSAKDKRLQDIAAEVLENGLDELSVSADTE